MAWTLLVHSCLGPPLGGRLHVFVRPLPIRYNKHMPYTTPQRETLMGAMANRRISPNSLLMRAYKDSLPVMLSPMLLAVAIGLMLGDANLLVTKKGDTACLRFE